MDKLNPEARLRHGCVTSEEAKAVRFVGLIRELVGTFSLDDTWREFERKLDELDDLSDRAVSLLSTELTLRFQPGPGE